MLRVDRIDLRVLRSFRASFCFEGTATIVDELHRQADSSIGPLSTGEFSLNNVLLVLNEILWSLETFEGRDSGPHEVLFLLLALKVRFPRLVF